MYSYEWDIETGGYLLNTTPLAFSKEPRPVYYQELDVLGFDKYWNYEKDDTYPYMWAEANNYWYRGRKVAATRGGSLYEAPEIIMFEECEPGNGKLKPVDMPRMVEKNKDVFLPFVQETIKNIYNTYIKQHSSIDVAYVAFSGGKDSVVILDLVQRALPHNSFKVLFGNTDMEFPTTIDLVNQVQKQCEEQNIEFYEAKSKYSAKTMWKVFGPPARKVRWCCTVHKTAPVINKICEIYNMGKINSMMITGVRGFESIKRSSYDEISMGKKMPGQISYHPLLEWSSADVYLYIYTYDLLLNEAYKYGFGRVGCIMCPNSSEKHEYIKRHFFEKEVDEYCDIIVETSDKDLSGENRKLFFKEGVWKGRLSGRVLKLNENDRVEIEESKGDYLVKVSNLNPNWKEWYKTIGELLEQDKIYSMEYNGIWRECQINQSNNITIFRFSKETKTKNSIEFFMFFKSILVKSVYCITCGTCVAECPNRCITMEKGRVNISDSCIKCRMCLKIQNGCLYYSSIRGSNTVKNLKGINKYLSVGVNANWITDYFMDNENVPGNRKTDVMFGFLTDAGVISKKIQTPFGNKIAEIGLDEVNAWALMLVNLAYTSAFGWYVHNIPIYETYIQERLNEDMGSEVTDKAKSEFWNGFKVILDSNKYFQEIGIGIPDIYTTVTKTGLEKKKMTAINRKPWYNADPKVILYSIYKFAEACGNMHKFTMTRLMDTYVDSDGVSPVVIFGLDEDTLKNIINGLTLNYPDFITATFSLGLDNINLNSEKTSKDVLDLF